MRLKGRGTDSFARMTRFVATRGVLVYVERGIEEALELTHTFKD